MTELNSLPTLGFIFGGVPEGIAFILYIMTGIFATMKAIRYTSGAATPLWLALIWLAPCIGAILAFIGIRRTDIHTELERLEDEIDQQR